MPAPTLTLQEEEQIRTWARGGATVDRLLVLAQDAGLQVGRSKLAELRREALRTAPREPREAQPLQGVGMREAHQLGMARALQIAQDPLMDGKVQVAALRELTRFLGVRDLPDEEDEPEEEDAAPFQVN